MSLSYENKKPLDGFLDWFIPMETIKNRTGNWFIGVLALKDEADLAKLNDGQACTEDGITKEMLSEDFGVTKYEIQTFTTGCYFHNIKTDEWESGGMTV